MAPSPGEDLDPDETRIKNSLFSEEASLCVCCRGWQKNLISGWKPSEERKEFRKRCEAGSRGDYRNHALLRRERTTVPPTDGFVFRHYESRECYIKQYRENHCSTCMERELDVKPVLGVDVPDPYLPKITTSSILVERMQIIEALSDYYKVATSRSEVKNICLTGKRAAPSERRSPIQQTPGTSGTETLPLITMLTNLTQDSTLTTVYENEACGPKNEASLACHDKIKDIRIQNKRDECNASKTPGHPSIRENKSKLPSARVMSQESERQRVREERATLPKVPQWTECDRHGRERTERILETLRIGKKLKSFRKDGCSEDSDDHIRKNLGTCGGALPPSRGNLCLGTTVRSPSKINQLQLGKCEVFSSVYPSELFQSPRKPTFSSETAFIKILGQATGPPPKPSNPKPEKKNMIRAKVENSPRDYRLPFQYVRRFGRHHFHHVLEARSYKPEHRKLGTTSIPN